MTERRITLQEQIEDMQRLVAMLEMNYRDLISLPKRRLLPHTVPALEKDLAIKRAILRTLEALVSDGK